MAGISHRVLLLLFVAVFVGSEDKSTHTSYTHRAHRARTVVQRVDGGGDEPLVDGLPLPLPRHQRQQRRAHLALDLPVHLWGFVVVFVCVWVWWVGERVEKGLWGVIMARERYHRTCLLAEDVHAGLEQPLHSRVGDVVAIQVRTEAPHILRHHPVFVCLCV